MYVYSRCHKYTAGLLTILKQFYRRVNGVEQAWNYDSGFLGRVDRVTCGADSHELLGILASTSHLGVAITDM